MSLKKLHILINTIIFILIISISFGCKTDVNTMIVDYGSMYGVAETYDSSPAPGDVNFNPESMLLDEYCNEIQTLLEIPGPTKCGSYRWRFGQIIENELVDITEILFGEDFNSNSSVLIIEKPGDFGFKIGETYYLTLTVTGKGGGVQYSDRAIVIFYEDRLKYSR